MKRDAQTGVIAGCEALDLDPPGGPDSATSACLLLHGFVGSRKDFAALGERLAAGGYHVRLARLPGHGTTPEDFASQTTATLLAGAREEIRALRASYRQVNVIGFSMGGTLATMLAAQGEADRLVLVAPYYAVTYRWFYLLSPETWNSLLSRGVPYVVKSSAFIKVNRPGAKQNLFSYRYVPTRGVSMLVELGKLSVQPGQLEKIKCPALLLMSEGDMAASPAAARAAFDRLGSRQKQAVWFSKSNHHLLSDWDAEEATDRILDFLNRQ